MTIEKFEDIISWQKAQDITVEIYKHVSNIRDFTFKDQICRAATSISNNIAEGFDRKTQKEFLHFLFIARGSNSEVKSMLYLGYRLGYFSELEKQHFILQTEEISKTLNGLIKYLYSKLEKKD